MSKSAATDSDKLRYPVKPGMTNRLGVTFKPKTISFYGTLHTKKGMTNLLLVIPVLVMGTG